MERSKDSRSRSTAQAESKGVAKRVSSQSKPSSHGTSKEREGSRRRDGSASRSKSKVKPEGRESVAGGARVDERVAATPVRVARRVTAMGEPVTSSQGHSRTPARRSTGTSEKVHTSISKEKSSSRETSRPRDPARATGPHRSDVDPKPSRSNADRGSRSRGTDEHLRARQSEGRSKTTERTPVLDKSRRAGTKTSESETRMTRASREVAAASTSKTVRRTDPSALLGAREMVTEEPKDGRRRTRTRVLSPSEIKMADCAPHVVDGAILGPSTSQLTGAGDNTANVFGDTVTDEDEGDFNYEDDFEDYESDFEADSSDGGAAESKVLGSGTRGGEAAVQGDEKKMDSGNYDMADSKRRNLHVLEIQAAMERENAALTSRHTSRLYAGREAQSSLVDEGFVEERSGEWRRAETNLNDKFINFAGARKRQKEIKIAARARRRGEELLSMIRLDVMSYKLYEVKPVPYDEFMKSYGRADTAQAKVQTNDDNLSEEVQTEEVTTRDMWTQKPPAFQVGGATSLEQERLGVGGPLCQDLVAQWDTEHHNVDLEKLGQFLSRIRPAMSHMLCEGHFRDRHQAGKTKLKCSRGSVRLGVEEVPFLEHRRVSLVRFAPGQPSTLLTVHQECEGAVDESDDSAASRSVVCVWDTSDPTSPSKLLAARSRVTAACFDSGRASLLVAGLEDGAVCVWDLREGISSHVEVTLDDKWLLRSPTYSTAEILRGEGHLSPVVALQPLIERSTLDKNLFAPTQVCSLEESGVVMLWTLIQSREQGLDSGMSDQDLGLAPWGRVRLVRSAVINLEDSLAEHKELLPNLQCLDLQLLSDDVNHLLIGTNTGHVVHGLRGGGKPSPRLYSPQSGGETFSNCIESCPFGLPIFLVGCGDGSVRMHRREKPRPLATMEGTGDTPADGPPVLVVQWSQSRPTVFFVLDSTSRIHVWDLSRSDLNPQYSMHITESVVSAIQLAPDLRNAKTPAKMAVATADGSVEVHNLKEEFSHVSAVVEAKELEAFIQFTDRL